MITIYRLFQIILGIILSAFILYILVYYAGSYALVGKEAIRFKTLDVFLQDVDSVYSSGIPVNFTEFSKDDYTSCHPSSGKPSRIWCFIDGKRYETENLHIPVFLRPGDNVLISMGSLDLGWTKIDYIEALTGMRIIFNPLEDDDAVWEAFREAIAGLPDTSGFFPKVTFGFCDGSNIIESEDAGSPWEKDYFYGIPQEYIGQLNKCTAHMSYNRILVTISSSCSPSFADSGICIKPPQDGVGEAYIAGSPRAYVYKDPVDLAALIIGGDRKDAVGYYVGEETWKFKNNFFLDSISLAAKFMERRNDFVTQHIPEKQEECVPAYESLKTSLINIQALARGDPYDVGEMSALKSELETARSLWLDLLDMGCESYVSG